MRQHYRRLSETKQQYRQQVQEYQSALERYLLESRSQFHCPHCIAEEHKPLSHWFNPRHPGCAYQAWQQTALQYLETSVATEILGKLQAIEAYKQTFQCHLCGLCCRVASADAPYEELQARARQGDTFSQQFTSIFLPYASHEAARRVAPDIVEAVLTESQETGSSETGIWFYHCPYIGEDNRCTLYGTDKRPAICENYPETPLSFVAEPCAWHPWKFETHATTLEAHAMLAICLNWSQKLRVALSLPPA